MARDPRPAWRNSNRRDDLPANWPELRAAARERNPQQICHWCDRPGGEALDHLNGDRLDNRLDNLDWIHDWRSVDAGVVERNCHSAKTAGDRPRLKRPPEPHPAL